jgi:hypothetical protein
MLGNLAVVDTGRDRRTPLAYRQTSVRRGEHRVTFRDGLHLRVMIARYLVGRYLEDFVPV